MSQIYFDHMMKGSCDSMSTRPSSVVARGTIIVDTFLVRHMI